MVRRSLIKTLIFKVYKMSLVQGPSSTKISRFAGKTLALGTTDAFELEHGSVKNGGKGSL